MIQLRVVELSKLFSDCWIQSAVCSFGQAEFVCAIQFCENTKFVSCCLCVQIYLLNTVQSSRTSERSNAANNSKQSPNWNKSRALKSVTIKCIGESHFSEMVLQIGHWPTVRLEKLVIQQLRGLGTTKLVVGSSDSTEHWTWEFSAVRYKWFMVKDFWRHKLSGRRISKSERLVNFFHRKQSDQLSSSKNGILPGESLRVRLRVLLLAVLMSVTLKDFLIEFFIKIMAF